MANADTPSGFRPYKKLDGSPYNGATIKCAHLAADTDALFVGDLVRLSGSASIEGYPSIEIGAAADTDFFGVVGSFDPNPSNLDQKHSPGTALRHANVIPAQNMLFVVQCDNAVVTDIGDTADIVLTHAGSTVTGLSGMEVVSIGTNLNVHVLGLDERPDNEFGDLADVIVKINETNTGGVGAGVD